MSAWVISPKPKQSSLLDIMSEQLVSQLNDYPSSNPSNSSNSNSNNDNNKNNENNNDNNNDNYFYYEDENGVIHKEIIENNYFYEYEQNIEQLDLQVQAQIQEEEEEELDNSDKDFALALALQEMEEFELSLNQQTQQSLTDEFSKINVASSFGETSFTARKGANILDEDLDSYASLADHRVVNGLRAFEQKRHHKGISASGRVSAKDTKMTFEGVLDPTTRMILYKLIQNNHLDKLYGVIKTGKEANVYHAYRQPNPYNSRQNNNPQSTKFHWNKQYNNFAVKIFKTTLNEFSNRQDYFHGDHRYGKQKFSKGGVKESIAKWTEKEYRNLCRAYEANLPVPCPIYFKENVLVMSLINESSSNQTESNSTPSVSVSVPNVNSNNTNVVPSPQLKEITSTNYSNAQLTDFYHQTLYIIYLLFHLCHLVHGDMSEYNLLLNQSTDIYLIDFGQSIDISHPVAYEYLLRDIKTINQYFLRCGVSIFTHDQVMNLIIEEQNSSDNISNESGVVQEKIQFQQEHQVQEEENENSHLYFEENKSKKVLKCNCHSNLKLPREEFYEILQNL